MARRKGEGPRDDERKKAAEAESALMDRVKKWAHDEEVMEALSPKDKAAIVVGRLPKPQAIDQDLEANLLSLTAALEDLPSGPDITQQIGAVKMSLRRCKNLLSEERAMCQMFKKKHADGEALMNFCRLVQKNAAEYVRGKPAGLFGEAELEAMVKEILAK